MLESFSKTITSLALFANIEWPLLEIPHFEVRAYDYLASSGAQLVSFAPVVTEEMRDQWEPFSVANQDWVQAGLQYEAEEKGGDTPTAEPIVEQIWRNALRSSTPVREYAAGPFVPLWQSYPAPQDSLIVNYSLMSHPSFEKLIKMVMETRVAVLSEIIDNTVLFGTAKSDDLNPKSVVVQPVFRDFENDADIVGFLVVIIPWDVYFHNVLFAGAHPIVAVLKNSCGDSFSYRVSGPQAHFLGEGDMHESRFEELEVSSEFANYTKKVIGNATTTHSAHSRGGLKSSCDYSVHIYPSSDMEDTMRTNMPMLVTAGVVIVFGFTSLVFILYDTIVQRRQRRVQNQANRTHKIVASLFPAEVHDRLFGTEDEVNGKKGALKSRAPKFHLMNFLSEEEQKNAEDGGEPRTKSKPIADLFPSATVM